MSRQDSTANGIVASAISVHKTLDKFAKKSWKWQKEYSHTSTSQLQISILASTGRVQVTRKRHKNSGVICSGHVFTVYCDVCDTTCCCVLFKC